jgi:hypothetical protein
MKPEFDRRISAVISAIACMLIAWLLLSQAVPERPGSTTPAGYRLISTSAVPQGQP